MAEKPILNVASLFELKAELLRKKEALKEAGLKRGLYDNFTGTKLKGIEKEPKVKKAKKPEIVPETNAEEELALQKSRSMLERKAVLYEKLKSGAIVPDEEQSEHFLVDFNKKVNDMPVTVQHEDSVKNVPIEVKQVKTTKYSNFVSAKENPDAAKDSSVDAEENDASGPVHYQNVQFKEVRNHGVGYFSFSMDEEERKKQMDALNVLRHHTEDEQKALLKKKRKRQAMLKIRLAKVRLRKNIPSKDDEDDDEEDMDEAESEDDGNDILEPDFENDSIQSKTAEESKPTRVRPWDKGKDFADLLPERKAKTPSIANKWLENRRAERVAGFAPPQSYSSSSKRTTKQSSGFYAPQQKQNVVNEQDKSSDENDDTEAARLISEKLSQIKQQF